MKNYLWHLPQGVSYLSPDRAEASEKLRTRILQLYQSKSIRLISLPLVETVHEPASVLAHSHNSAQDLDAQAASEGGFFFDEASGRWLRLRNDATLQVAQYAAMQEDWGSPQKYCYAETVFAKNLQQSGLDRQYRQYGVEFLHCDADAPARVDSDVIALLVETITMVTQNTIHLSIGHGGVLAQLLAAIQPNALKNPTIVKQLRVALQRKAKSELMAILDECAIEEQLRQAIVHLTEGASTPQQFEENLLGNPLRAYAAAELDAIAAILNTLKKAIPDVKVQIDLGDTHFRSYHSGLVFSCYVEGYPLPVGRGGRYDLTAYGGTTATGFSLRSDSLLSIQQR